MDGAIKAHEAKQEYGEPVGEVIRLSVGGDVDWFSFVPEVGTLLYTAPQQRKPLTDEQIKAIRVDCGNPLAIHIEFARAIEAAHGIKE
jgi:hypothetical protein